jgi:epoxyqueuosine reductase
MDPSALVRAMAVWALSKLVPSPQLAALAEAHLPDETDAAVQAEWRAAISPAR